MQAVAASSPPGAGPGERPAAHRPPVLVAVAACLFLSGAAALTLEVTWSRSLRLVFGSTTLAISTILVAYMLGLGLGGLVGGRVARRLRNGVRTYGWVEIAVGVYALLVPSILGLLPALDVGLATTFGFWGAALVRFVAVLAVLMLPTTLMGATLPILVAALVRRHEGIAGHVGLLYGINTLGAVTGVLTATFLLFPSIGLWRTNVVGALAAAAVGLVALLVVAPRSRGADAPTDTAAESRGTGGAAAPPSRRARWNPVLTSYGVVGFTALAFEVCWTRALAMILGSSVYAFATMLAAFLLGIALGSLVARRSADRLARPQAAYAIGLGVLGLTALGTVVAFNAMPRLFVHLVDLLGASPAGIRTANVTVSMLAMLPPTLVLGALFPLLLRALATEAEETNRLVGNVYFVNTVGCALGAFAAGFVLIPSLGLLRTMAGLVALNLFLAAGLLLWQRQWEGKSRGALAYTLAALAGFVLVNPPAWNPTEFNRGAYLLSVHADEWQYTDYEPLVGLPPDAILFYREGINTTVTVDRRDGATVLRVNGKPDASSHGDMGTQVLLGQVPMLFGGAAERMMVIGLASGVTVGSAALHDPASIDVVELEPAMIEASRYFDHLNDRPLDRPGTRVVLEDGRIHLARRPQPYDVIISEPSNPWISGVANLFTAEFFRATRQALEPDGRLLQWVQLYGLDIEAWRSILAAMQREFGYLYVFQRAAEDTDSLVLAMSHPLTATDMPRWEGLSAPVRADLERIGTYSTPDLWSLLRLGPEQTAAIAAESSIINTDDNMHVELSAPLSMHDKYAATAILQRIAAFPDGALPHLEGAGVDLSDDEVGDLALAYATRRGNPAVARRIAAARPGLEAHRLALDAQQRFAAATTEPEFIAARTLLDQALTARPDLVSLRLQRAEMSYRIRHFDRADEDLQVFLATHPDHALARALRARVRFELGRFAEARSEAMELIERGYAGLDSNLYRLAAAAAHGEGDSAAAFALFDRFFAVRPHNLHAWQSLLQFATEARDEQRIEQARENVARTERNRARGQFIQALRMDRSGDLEGARSTLHEVLRVLPAFAAARERLQRIERDLENPR